MNYRLNEKESKQLSGHINGLCTAVGQESVQIYARQEDLLVLAPNLLKDDLDEDDYKEGRKSKNFIKNNETLIEQNMKNRCFMQKFNQNSLQKQSILKDNQLDSLSNYERLKLKLKKQMMPKSTKLDKLDDLNRKSNSFSKKSSLSPKSLNDFSSYWQEKERVKPGESKLLNLIYSNAKSSHKNIKKRSSCYCKIEICIPWYPCTVKFCRSSTVTNDSNVKTNKTSNDLNRSDNNRVRCGIRSCKKCWLFYYQVENKQACLWDDL